MSMTKLRCLAVTIALALMIGCGSNQSLVVTTIQLGRALNSDSTVAGFTTTFRPDDTVYLSVLTNGAGSATMSVRWLYGGRVIDEPKKQVSYKMAAATDFRLQSPSGFPTGDYTAEVFLNGQSVATRTFRVDTR